MANGNFNLDPGKLTLADIRDWMSSRSAIELSDSCRANIAASQQTVQAIVERDQTVYGINTGFGLLAQKRISPEDLKELQTNLVLSHSAGTGEDLSSDVVRLVILLKINSLARGYSGVRGEVIDLLVELLNRGIMPCIPCQGSVGASGDLAPLAHLASVLIGAGEVTFGDARMPAKKAFKENGLSILELEPKEGLALLNGTQVSTALAINGLMGAANVFSAAVIAGAMSTDAAMGSDTPFDPRIHELRLHAGQKDCAAAYRNLLGGSGIRDSHAECEKVQDPYSLRCQPQVMGACLDQMRYVAGVLGLEANAVSDNPLVFPEQGDVLSGGNFHAEPVAMAADALAVAIAEIGSLAERRIALLVDGHLSGLPDFLVTDGGLNSGFMIPQVTAAALASENKTLAFPSSVDSLPTSANQEDHVSMATYAARRLENMVQNTAAIIGIELLAAAQGIDFRGPLQSSPLLMQAHQAIRKRVAFYDHDRTFAPDIEQIKQLAASDYFLRNFELPVVC